MTFRTLIQVDDLHRHLGDAEIVIFDCRHDLMKPDAGAQAYAQSHIPGARFAHSDKDLSGPKTGKTGRHPAARAGALHGLARRQRRRWQQTGRRLRPRWWCLRHAPVVDAALAGPR